MVRFPLSRLLLLMAVAGVAIIVAACSSSDSPTGPGGGGNPGPNAINISGNDFTPGAKTIAAGTTITWTNKDAVSHTVTSDDDGFTSSGNLAHNATYQFTFTTPGVYPYHCAVHPSMKDTITVTP